MLIKLIFFFFFFFFCRKLLKKKNKLKQHLTLGQVYRAYELLYIKI